MSTNGIAINGNLAPTVIAGVPINWSEHGNHAHVVQFYEDDSFLIGALSRFIGTSLGAGDAAVVIATKPHRDALAKRLKDNGINAPEAMRSGRYVVLDAAETLAEFMVDGMPDRARFVKRIGSVITKAQAAITNGGSHVAAFGEMVSLLWQRGNFDAAVQLEELWNSLAETHSFSLHCAYPSSSFTLEAHNQPFEKICAAHSRVLPDESYLALTTDEERLRNIALMQQRHQVAEALQRTKQELERQVEAKIKIEQKLRESEESLRALSSDLLRTQDKERRHLGRELHDGVGQYLAALKMNLDLMKPNAEPAGEPYFQECVTLVEQAMVDVRTMSYLLHPPLLEEMGLSAAIPWYVEGFSKRSGIAVSLDMDREMGRLPADVEICIFRILQESLTNVHRHSGSRTAEIAVSLTDAVIHLSIKDHGTGIPANADSNSATAAFGVGLRGMNERVRQFDGRLRLDSSDQGTTIEVSIPCETASSVNCEPSGNRRN